jgi:hypothetical protein
VRWVKQYLLVKSLEQGFIVVLTFQNGGLLLRSAQLSAPELNQRYTSLTNLIKGPTFFGDSKCLSDLIQVEDVGLHTVESALLLQDHLGHLVSREGRKNERGRLALTYL